jgi:hypothetical protein
MCDIKLRPGEVQQYSKPLRIILDRRRGEESGGGRSGGG